MAQIQERERGYDFIRFLAILLIFIHHFYTSCRDYKIQLPIEIQNIISHGALGFGKVGVALFFILSGAVLLMSNKYSFSIKDYFKKRFLRICIPQWIGFTGALLLTIAAGKKINCDIIGGVISFLGLNYSSAFWKELNIKTIWIIGEWFTAVIILLYLLFALLRYLFNNYRFITTTIIITIFVINLDLKFMTYGNGWFSITNGLMCFWLGMFFEEYKHHFNKKVTLVSALIALTIYLINPKTIIGHAYLTCFIFSIFLFIALHQVKFSNKFTQYLCKYCYEIYLTHHRIYIILIPALLKANHVNDFQILLAFVFLTGIVFLLSEQLQKLSNFIIKKIQNVLQDQKRKKTNV